MLEHQNKLGIAKGRGVVLPTITSVYTWDYKNRPIATSGGCASTSDLNHATASS